MFRTKKNDPEHDFLHEGKQRKARFCARRKTLTTTFAQNNKEILSLTVAAIRTDSKYTVYVLHKCFFQPRGCKKYGYQARCHAIGLLWVFSSSMMLRHRASACWQETTPTLDCQVAALKKNNRMVIFNYTYMDPNATWEGTCPPKSTPKYFLRNHIWNEAKPAENLAWTSGNPWDPSMGWQLHTSATLRLNGFGPPQSNQKRMLSRKGPALADQFSILVRPCVR
jgi:hypothetical protein